MLLHCMSPVMSPGGCAGMSAFAEGKRTQPVDRAKCRYTFGTMNAQIER
jgi:hypothetical protein